MLLLCAGDLCEIEGACLSGPCENGATCQQDDLDPSNFTCECAPGWTGVTCSTNIDECADEPCANNATCVDLIADFNCVCADGFTGDRCRIDINDCADEPCENGECVDLVNGYRCDCDEGE